MNLLGALSHWIITVISTMGYAGILLLMAIESACIPLPSEVILPFAGYLAFTGRFHLAWIAVIGALGCNLGSDVAYWVGHAGGRPLAERYGRMVLVSRRDIDLAEHWFQRFGDATVFFARLLPVIRTFIALPAGIARMPLGRFNLYTFLGSVFWCWALAYAGFRLGQHWDILRVYFHRFDLVIVAALALLAALWIWRHVRELRRAA